MRLEIEKTEIGDEEFTQFSRKEGSIEIWRQGRPEVEQQRRLFGQAQCQRKA